jgi:hypothetical protein
VIAGKSSKSQAPSFTEIPNSKLQTSNVQRERALCSLELGVINIVLSLGFGAWPRALKKFECEM